MKGEGKNHFSILNFLRYKVFSKIYHIYFYRNTATINFYNKEIGEQNAKQIFSFRQVCKAPKEGHYWAKARALLSQGKGTFVLGQEHFCAPEKHKRAQVRHHP